MNELRDRVLIIGGGPAGSTSAMNLIAEGMTPIIVESVGFPRFHIGESLTTECVHALNRLGLEAALQTLRAPQKQGVRIFSKHPQNSFFVGAGDAWQVERARFDQMLLETAVARGAQLIHGKVVALRREDGEWLADIALPDEPQQTIHAHFVIDASGQDRFSVRQGILGPIREGDYARQIAFFSQFEGVERQPNDHFDTLIHHRGDFEWVWMIPLSEQVTSIGLVLPVEAFKTRKQPAEQFLDTGLANFSVPVAERVGNARRVGPVRTMSNYSYRIDEFARDGLFCVGDSHAFIDPIFSFCVEFVVKEAEYVRRAIVACRDSDPREWPAHAVQYMRVTTDGQRVVEDMLAYFWKYPWGFAHMAHVRHKDEFLEIFAGRIYEIDPGEGLNKMRATLS